MTELDFATLPSPDATVEKVCVALGARRVKEHTRRQYYLNLRRFLRWCIDERIHPLLIDHAQLAAYTDHLGQSLSRATIAAHQSNLNAFYDEAVRLGALQRSPMDGFRRSAPKHTYVTPTILPVATVRAIRHGASGMNARARAVIELMALNGLEVAEIGGAIVEDLRPDGHSYWLTVAGRNGRRDVRLAPPVVEPLLEHLAGRRRGPLIAGRSGDQIDRYAMARIVSTAARRGGVTGRVTPRELRHAFIAVALSQGVPLSAIRDSLGISDVRGLDRFVATHASAADVPLRVTQAIVSDAESGLLDQARRLLDLEIPVHVAAPVVLIGAALEEHLRSIVNREALPISGHGSIMAYAGALRAAGLLTAAEMPSIDSWARLRNDAAHGDLSRLTQDAAEAMFMGVRDLLSRVT